MMHRLSNIWEWLVCPSAGLTKNDQKQARRLSGFILIMIIAGTAVALPTIFIAKSINFLTILTGTIFTNFLLLVAYLISRTKHIGVATILLIVFFDLAIVIAVIRNMPRLTVLTYLILPILVGSLFLSWRLARLMALAHIGIVLFLPVIVPTESAMNLWRNSPFTFVVFSSAIILLAAWERDNLEKERKANLAWQVHERTQELETLRAAGLALTQSLDLDSVLATVLDYLRQLVPYDSANVMLRQGESALVISAVCGYEQWLDNHTDVFKLSFDVTAVPMLSDVLDKQQSLMVPDTAQEPRWVSDLAGATYIKSWLGVPLIAGGHCFGLYSLDNHLPNAFDQRHLQLAESLAAQVATAVDNARLYKQVVNGQQRLRRLAQREINVQEAERLRLSRELHDEAGQALTVMKFSLTALQKALVNVDAATKNRLQDIVDLLDITAARLRTIAHDLRPSALDDLGLNPALESYCVEFSERTGLNIRYSGMDVPELPDEIGISLYRFLQEGLTNAVKHAAAQWVEVCLQLDAGHILLSIQDDGCGLGNRPQIFRNRDSADVTDSSRNPQFTNTFDFGKLSTVYPEATAVAKQNSESPNWPSGIGLSGLSERFKSINGHVEISSKVGQGTLLMATVPMVGK